MNGTDVQSDDRYVSPAIRDLGSVHVLTEQQDKQLGETDGFTFLGQPITNNSP